MITRYINRKKGERPKLSLTVCRVESTVWERFKKHHYMSEQMNKGAKCFLFFWDSQPVAFAALLNRTFKGCNKNDHIVSRIVVLPQFQGLGFGRDVMNALGGIVKSIGGNLYIKTIHTKMGKFLDRSPLWEPTANNNKERDGIDGNAKNRQTRKSFSYKYTGNPIYGYEHLFTPIKELRKIANK